MAYEQTTEHGRSSVQAPFAIFAGMGKNVQAIAAEITKISQENIEAGTKAAEKLREAKNLPEVIAVQTDLVKSTLETFSAHYPRIAEIAASAPVDLIKGYQDALGKVAEAGNSAARETADVTRSIVEQTSSAARQASERTADAARDTARSASR